MLIFQKITQNEIYLSGQDEVFLYPQDTYLFPHFLKLSLLKCNFLERWLAPGKQGKITLKNESPYIIDRLYLGIYVVEPTRTRDRSEGQTYCRLFPNESEEYSLDFPLTVLLVSIDFFCSETLSSELTKPLLNLSVDYKIIA